MLDLSKLTLFGIWDRTASKMGWWRIFLVQVFGVSRTIENTHEQKRMLGNDLYYPNQRFATARAARPCMDDISWIYRNLLCFCGVFAWKFRIQLLMTGRYFVGSSQFRYGTEILTTLNDVYRISATRSVAIEMFHRLRVTLSNWFHRAEYKRSAS